MNYPMHCPECGRSGNEEDGCVVGEPCPDEECSGTVEWSPGALSAITFKVTIHTDGDVDDLGRCFAQYIAHPEFPFLTDYAADGEEALRSGYEGPFVRRIDVVEIARAAA